MKSITKVIIFLGLCIHLNAQSNNLFNTIVTNDLKTENKIKLNQSLNILNWLKLEVSPQFGGLFDEAINNRKNKINLKNYYNDFDFGLKFGVVYEIIKTLNFGLLYNIGMLKFDLTKTAEIESANMKLSLVFNF